MPAMSASLLARWAPLASALRGGGTRRLAAKAGSVVELENVLELPREARKHVLLRDRDVELRSALSGKSGKSGKSGLLLLAGERGTGKSTSLRGAVAAARKAGAVVLYIPRASVWTMGGGFFAAARGDLGDRDDAAPVRWYDRPKQTSALLQALLSAHGRALANVPCAGGEWETAKQAAEEGVRLVQTVDDDWRTHPRRAGEALSAVIESCAAHADTRFIVAVDEYEAFTGLTELGSGRGRWVHANAMPLVGRYLGRDKVESFASSIDNGAVVLACGDCGEGRRIRRSRVLETADYPLSDEIRADPSGRIWRRDFWEAQQAVLRYERFGFKELQTLQGLQGVGEGGDRAARMRAVLLSGGRADVLHKLNASL